MSLYFTPAACTCLLSTSRQATDQLLFRRAQAFAIFWTIAGLIAIVVCLLAIAKEGRNNASWVFGNFESQAGWPAGWSFFIGLLQAAYATSATGMIISCVIRPCIEIRLQY